jgi:aminoglycoside 6'-N-acetyltransferase
MEISITPLCSDHFLLLLKWLESPHVKKWWDNDISWTETKIHEKYESYVDGYEILKLEDGSTIKKTIHPFIIKVDGLPIGYIQYYNKHDFPSHHHYSSSCLPQNCASFDIYIGEKEYIGHGIGQKTLRLLLPLMIKDQYMFIFADPERKNIQAIKCYQKVGFRKMEFQPSDSVFFMLKPLAKVRLSDNDLSALVCLFLKYFGLNDKLWLFGSRADLTKKGGDIDLYIETHAENMDIAIKMKYDFLGELEEMIGEQKIDVVLNMINFPYLLQIHEVAIANGVRII